MGPLAAAAKSALSPQEVLANMQFGAHLFKGTRSIRSITFVVMQADLWQEGRVILEQKLAEFIVAKSAVESVLSEHRVVVGRVEVVNKLAFLPTKQNEDNTFAHCGTPPILREIILTACQVS